MSEKWPSSSSLRLMAFLFLIVSVLLVVAWSYYSSEWWSAAYGVLAAFFFIEAVVHMNVYAVLSDITKERK